MEYNWQENYNTENCAGCQVFAYWDGGMPGNISIIKDNPNDLDMYLEGIFTTIVYKDIITRNNITDKMILENVLKFIFDSIGSPISTKKISDTLTSKGISTSNHTVENYISAFV